MDNIKLKTTNYINILYLFLFIVTFIGLFIFVEILQEKSNRKRLLKKEVSAISSYVKNKCPQKNFDPICASGVINSYLQNRENLFGNIPNYLNISKIEMRNNQSAESLGLFNDFNKNYELPFHNYYKLLGVNTFLETYTTTSLIFDYGNGRYSFILGSMSQIDLAYPIFIKSSLYLILLIIVLFFYIRFFPDKVDCPFFYSGRDRITTKFFIFLLALVVFFLLIKSFLDPYEIKGVYSWILWKMNPYKIHEFILYIFCLIGFLVFYIFKDKLKVKKSYGTIVKELLNDLIIKIQKGRR